MFDAGARLRNAQNLIRQGHTIFEGASARALSIIHTAVLAALRESPYV